jgi:DNA polymerase alpha subunit A
VFVNSNVTTYPEALKIANDFKKLVNERYKLLEIDLDAVFERILLLNKKKYAAVKIDESGEKATEVKGLDMKRREFSKISKDSSRWVNGFARNERRDQLILCSAVLKEILSGEATEVVISKIHELLTALGESVRNGNVPLDDFIVFKVGSADSTIPAWAFPSVFADPFSDWARTRRITRTRSLSRTSRLR